MKSIDWKALKPHVPLGPKDTQYVARTGSAGEEIAQWIRADRSPLLIGGPTGVGKSTELARAAGLLQPHRVACLVQLDRFENMRRLSPDRMRLRIAQSLAKLAQQALHLPLSETLQDALRRVEEEFQGLEPLHNMSPTALLNATLEEIGRLSQQGKVILLIDGLEKVPEGPVSLDLFEALAGIQGKVELVVVIPWHAAFGPQAETVIRAGERFVAVRALDVQTEAGAGFLRDMLLLRLGWHVHQLEEEDTGGLVSEAIRWSGGLPRVFLQLLADAASYAKIRRSGSWPCAEDLNDARADQVDSFRRLLQPGDVDASRRAADTNGNELELDRKIRLMAHGILLERLRGGTHSLDIHPLAQEAFAGDGAHA